MTCPHCRFSTPDGSRFCSQCGGALVTVCGSCGSSNELGSRFCSQCGLLLPPGIGAGGPAADNPPPPDGGLARSPILGDETRRPVTVLFADIVGFTSLSERLDPEEVRDVTAACFGRLVEEVVRRGGTVDKFIGDAVMALFGTPIAHEDDPGRAVDAALAMQAALGEINGDLERDHGLRLELRIGVNTGEVVAGVREVGGFQDGTVIGDTVNTASRLQSAAAPGSVLVGETTARLSRHLFELEPVPPLTLRGKTEPVQAFRAVGPLMTVPVANAASVPLVGRAHEVAALLERVERLERGEGGVVVITGEPGSGKSRLLTELRRLVETRPGIRLGEAHATAYGPGQTTKVFGSWAWAVFAEELTELATARAVSGAVPAGLAVDDPPGVVELTLGRLRARLDQLGASEALPFLCFLLDLPRPIAHAYLDDLSPEEIHRRGLGAIRKLHVGLAAERPCIVSVDDLHWAGPTALRFMESAAELTARVPLLLVLSFRADVDAPSWALREHCQRVAGPLYTELLLEPLDAPQTRTLALSLLGGATLDERAEAVLLSRIDGNPLYACEMIQTLVDRGALVIENGRVSLDEQAARRVPETLQATILARIDRLPEDARRVVQTGAVLGRTFSRQLLTRVFGDGPGLERGLREALRAGVLVARPTPSRPGFNFAQGLVQEVAERTLLIRRRREIHRQAMHAIEAVFPDDLSAHAPGLARHAHGAEEWSAAARYALLAAEQAASDYATREALRFYDLGLEAAGHLGGAASPVQLCELLGGRARMLAHLGLVEAGVEALQAALDVARTPGFADGASSGLPTDPSRLRAQLALALATMSLHRLDMDTAEDAIREAFEVLEEGHPELASAWALRSWALLHQNQGAEAAEAARTALRLALAHGGFEERARAYIALTRPGLAGEIGPSIATYASEAVRLAREHHHEGFLFEALISREILRQICLQPHTEVALDSAREALDLARRMDSQPYEGAARIVLGVVCLAAGRWDEAEQELTSEPAVQSSIASAVNMRRVTLARLLDARGRSDEAADLAEIDASTFPHGAVWLSTSLASHHVAAGDLEQARRAIARAIEAQATVRCLACEAMLGGVGAEVLAAAGDPDGALVLARQAEQAGDGAFVGARLLAARARSRVSLEAGRRDQAIAEAEAARTLAEELGQPYERALVLLALGAALARRAQADDQPRARMMLGEALETFDELGARPAAERAIVELARLDTQPATLTP